MWGYNNDDQWGTDYYDRQREEYEKRCKEDEERERRLEEEHRERMERWEKEARERDERRREERIRRDEEYDEQIRRDNEHQVNYYHPQNQASVNSQVDDTCYKPVKEKKPKERTVFSELFELLGIMGIFVLFCFLYFGVLYYLLHDGIINNIGLFSALIVYVPIAWFYGCLSEIKKGFKKNILSWVLFLIFVIAIIYTSFLAFFNARLIYPKSLVLFVFIIIAFSAGVAKGV